TGTASGIGRAVALRIAGEGGEVILADRNEAGAAETAQAIGASGGAAEAIGYDAMDGAQTAAMVERAVAVHGRLDAVLNVAGIYQREHFEGLAAEDWQRMLQINLTSVFEIAQRALPALIETGGSIVNTASI